MTETYFTQQTFLQEDRDDPGKQESLSVCILRASNIWASPHGRMKEAGQVKLAERSEGRSQGNIDKSTIPSLLFPLRFCI